MVRTHDVLNTTYILYSEVYTCVYTYEVECSGYVSRPWTIDVIAVGLRLVTMLRVREQQ